MDRLIEELRRLDPPAPPSAVDVDRLIVGERHRARRVRLFGAAGAVLVAAALVAAAPWAVRPDATPDGADVPSASAGVSWTAEPSATYWSCGAESRSAAVRAAAEGMSRSVADVLSDVDGVNKVGWVTDRCDPAGAGYRFVYTVEHRDGRIQSVAVEVLNWAPPAGATCFRPDATCERSERADGSVVYRAVVTHQGIREIEVYRPDGIAVRAAVIAFPPSRPMLLDWDRLLRIADLPGLTL